MSEGRQDVVEQAIEHLRILPPVDHAHVSRIVAAAVEARATGLEDRDAVRRDPRARRLWSLSVVLGLAAAAGVAGFVVRGVTSRSSDSPTAEVSSAVDGVQPASSVERELMPIMQQFILEQPGATSVRLLADFNGWGADSTIALARDGSGTWSVVLPVVPGRHLYMFLVDDSIQTLDPRNARAKDPDFGHERSVVIVGRP